jgi:Flp pilus assembly protein CpaB
MVYSTIYSTATVAVNPEDETKLTRAQSWAGLELKARDARGSWLTMLVERICSTRSREDRVNALK